MSSKGNSKSWSQRLHVDYEQKQPQYEKPSTVSSEGDSSSWVQKVLVDYIQKQSQYEELVRLTRETCEELLGHVHIKGVVQGRVKNYNSLQTKLLDSSQAAEFSEWVAENNDIYMHQDMGDLAGVRIGLFFPDDIVRVVEIIGKHFHEIHSFGTIRGGRKAVQDANLAIEKHGNGAWFDEAHDDWEHYGYKSWQMVVEWKDLPHKNLSLRRVEIQIGTVVTQAWAEVQHNTIYKNPADIRATPTMKRMIDAINGLAITTDIMLKELQRSLEQAKKEKEAFENQPFRNGRDFLS